MSALKCHLRFVNPQPSESFLNNYYSIDYYNNYIPNGYHSIEASSIKDWKEKLDLLNDLLIKKTVLIELGSAYGFFLKYCIERGWKNVEGLEISLFSSEYARKEYGLNILTGDIMNRNYEKKPIRCDCHVGNYRAS